VKDRRKFKGSKSNDLNGRNCIVNDLLDGSKGEIRVEMLCRLGMTYLIV